MSNVLLKKLTELEQRHPWQSLTVNGHEWRWLDTQGQGPAIILLPGSVGDGAMFVPTLLSLGDQRRLIAVTYPAEPNPKALADGLAEIMDHIDLASATIVGSSFAAYWSQHFALRHADKVEAIIIGNGFTDGTDLADNPLFDKSYVETVDAVDLHAQWLERIRNAPASDLAQFQEHMLAHRQSPQNLHSRFLGVVQSQPCPPLPIRPERITILDCEDDPLIPVAARTRLRNQYPDAQHITLKTGAHYPHLLNPEEYEATLLQRTS